MAGRYADRHDAGQDLAQQLSGYAGRDDAVVLGLARGGVPVAYEVAVGLGLPLDVLTVRKLGVPGQEELAFGALATGGVRVLNQELIEEADIEPATIDTISESNARQLEERERLYRGDRPPLEVGGRTVILVDDGLATGATMRAAVEAVRRRRAARIVVAVPLGAARSCAEMAAHVDEVVCARMPDPFLAVGLGYGDFSPTSDEEVRALLVPKR